MAPSQRRSHTDMMMCRWCRINALSFSPIVSSLPYTLNYLSKTVKLWAETQKHKEKNSGAGLDLNIRTLALFFRTVVRMCSFMDRLAAAASVAHRGFR